MTVKFLQFGTSRFLQAHVDLFIEEAKAGYIAVVETTGSPASRTRVKAFRDQASYPVHVRGQVASKSIDETKHVSCVTDGLSAREDLKTLTGLFVDEASYIISNTGDRGFDLPSNIADWGQWNSYPELLTNLLYARYNAGGTPITIFPCELISGNGDVLRNICLKIAEVRCGEQAFLSWLANDCIWVNSLVDRIVSEPVHPIGAVAEPYALWAIENQPGLAMPFEHPAVEIVDDLESVERRKLHLLNLGHTLLAQKWFSDRRPQDETVRQALMDQNVSTWLSSIVENEVIPAFDEDRDQAASYWLTCLDRFANPFLDHRISDIATNHEAKVQRRIIGLMEWKSDHHFPILSGLFSKSGESNV